MRRALAAALLLALAGGAWLAADFSAFLDRPLAVPPEGLLHEVAPGTSLTALARALERRGALDRPRYLAWYGRWRGLAHRIQAGEYRIPPGTRPPELLAMLAAGRVRLHRLTVVEGWTFRELRAALARHEAVVQVLEGVADEAVMARLGRPGEHPEGWFLPDTYRFPRGTTDVEFLRRAHQAMVRLLEREWSRRTPDLPLRRPYDALILASIVEKETSLPEERPLIAGVFVRRLARGMRLQADPTVIYGLGERFDGNLRRRDLRRDTPYNTYTRRGLPPTPICLPGRAAIRAVLHPAAGDALYFVAKGDGSHHFSATLEEHRRAVVRYQLRRTGGR